ncbi:MAG TPA: HAD-IA family hydrolase [Solirubrobacteraceae bacterium]|jgi:HAD superfamily hydrolase (TIGR01549 family)
MAALIFDLDETLLDTSMLRTDRRPGRWRQLALRLDEVQPYAHVQAGVQAADLPARARKIGFRIGILTDSPRWYAERLLGEFGIRYDALLTGSDGYAPKPDPSSLRALAAQLGTPVEQCILVGDEASDFGAAYSSRALCIGVAWSRHAPSEWRRHWPDIAVEGPAQLLEALENPRSRLPFAEALIRSEQPAWHWGSLLRLGDGIFGAGRYYTRYDSRHPGDRLSRLIVRAKGERRAAARAGKLLGGLVAPPRQGATIDLITSVPPKPGAGYDRLAHMRAALATTTGAVESGEILRQRFDDPSYKRQHARARPRRVAGRFAASTLSGEHILLLDDVITSGAQVRECRRQLLAQGADRVTILVLGVAQNALTRYCPLCSGTLHLVTSGPYGDFIGCSNYRRGCRYREPAPPV